MYPRAFVDKLITKPHTSALTMEASREVPVSAGGESATQPVPVPTRLAKQAGTPDHNTHNSLTHQKQTTQPTSYLDPRLSHSEALSAFFSSDPDNAHLTVEDTKTDYGESTEPQTTSHTSSRLSLFNKARRIGRRRIGRPRSKSESSSSPAKSSVSSGVHWGNIPLPPSHLLSESENTQTQQKSGLTKSATWSDSLHRATSSGIQNNNTTTIEGGVNTSLAQRTFSPQQDTQPRSILVGSQRKAHSRSQSEKGPLRVRFAEEISYSTPNLGQYQSPSPSPDPISPPTTPSHTSGRSSDNTRGERVQPPAPTQRDTFPVTQGTTIAFKRKGKTKIKVYNPSYADLPAIVEREPGDIPPPLRPLPRTPLSFREITESTQERDTRVAREMQDLQDRLDRAARRWNPEGRADEPFESDGAAYQVEGQRQQLNQNSAHAGTYRLESQTEAASGVRDPLGLNVGADDADDSHSLSSDGSSLYHDFRFSNAERIADSPPASDGLPCPLTPIQEEMSSVGSQNDTNERIAALGKMRATDQEEEVYPPVSPGHSTSDLSRVSLSERPGTTGAPDAIEEPARITTPGLVKWAEASYEATTETARAVVTTRPANRHTQVDITTMGPSAHRSSLDDNTTRGPTTTMSALRAASSSALPSTSGTQQQRGWRSGTAAEHFNTGLAPQLPPIRLSETMHYDSLEQSVLGASILRPAVVPSSSSSRSHSRADLQTPPDARIQQQLQAHLLTPTRSRGPVRSAAALTALVEEEVERHQKEARSRPMGYAEVAAFARRDAELRARTPAFTLRSENDVRRLVRHELMRCGPLFEAASATPERLRYRAMTAATDALEEQHGDAAGYRIAAATTDPRPPR